MKNKLAMFTGMYIFASITAGVYAYKKITELKQQRDNQFNALELLNKNNEENWQNLFKEYEELQRVVSRQNLIKMNLLVEMDEKDSRLIKLEAENGRLQDIKENLEHNLGEARAELKSLRARLADYECPDELAIKL